MEFNGTILITDPCYISKRSDWGKGFDWNTNTINVPGFTNYIWEATGYGDGKWKVSELNNILGTLELEEFVEKIENAYLEFFDKPTVDNEIKLEGFIQQRNTIGRFCVDSGSYGIFKLDEVLSYNSDFLKDYGNWCYTIIPDFIGDIEIYHDDRNNFHILGVGNKTFYSNTVSWL